MLNMPAYADVINTENEAHASNLAQNDAKASYILKNPNDDVVVSGMSGRFPESSNVRDFSRNLFEGIDMVTEDDRRWQPGLFGLPHRSGKIPNLSNFDASFFSVSPRQAHAMDPQLRLLLEVSYEAIFDAGLHPNVLRGKRVGVYVGVSGSETEEFITKDADKITGYELTGCCRAMFANRLSYALDLKGPSFAMDTACSSAFMAFHTAYRAIAEGEIDAAIVAGSNLTLKPQSSLQFHTLSMLSEDGRCKAFDSRANGYVRSEAVTAVFLQKRRDASRIYAEVVFAGANTDGFKGEGITFPSGEVQKELLVEVYQRAGVDPKDVSYVEAHGTGTKAGDPQELNAIADIFCQNRSEPLLIGSVKSNMGHSEPASGLCALIKVLLAMQHREIPGNLHFESPNPDIVPLNNGKLKVVSENTPWRGPYAAVNCFGFGGANVHVLLKSPENFTNSGSILKSLNSANVLSRKNSNVIIRGGIPRLSLSLGRTQEHAEEILQEFQRNRDVNFASLLDNINEAEASSVAFPYRGYTLVGGNNDDRLIMNVSECPSERKPLWLIFSGMGSQWKGCGQALLDLPPFDDTIQKCRSALLPLGIDVLDIITREDPNPMKSTTNSFVAIAAIQVGLVDVLKSVGLTNFDGYVGHSVGELGCGYIDGTLTAEQTVLAAYWRGKSVEEANLPEGAMAAVGLSAEDMENRLGRNSSVTVACRNSANSVTISGPTKDVEAVKEKLDNEGVFCRSVDSGGIAFHHASVRKAAPRLLAELQKIILIPAKRSSKWISSSVPEAKWETGISQKASPEYLVNNLVSPVYFAEALAKIPEEARVIEVAPHALMQAVLRRALPTSTMFPLVRKESTDIQSHLLECLGKLYLSGEKVNLRNLYPPSKIPVPVNTPSIGSLVRWDHSLEWDVAKFGSSTTSEFKLEVDLNDATLSYLEGHTIDGRILFPATGYMTLAWRALAKLLNKKYEELPVTFNDVVLHQATVLSTNSVVTFTVRLLISKGEFEVLAGDSVAASGKIFLGVKESQERDVLKEYLNKNSGEKHTHELTHDEVYKELKLRGYQYSGDFRGVKVSDLEGTAGELLWKDKWIPFLDTLLQFSLIGSSSKGLYLPTRIRKVYIEPQKLYSILEETEVPSVKVNHSHKLGISMCPGVEIYGLKATMAPQKAVNDNPQYEGYHFYPNFLSVNHKESENLSFENGTKLIVDIVLENIFNVKVKIAHVVDEELESPVSLAKNIVNVFEAHPIIAVDYLIHAPKNLPKNYEDELESLSIEVVEKIEPNNVPKLNLLVVSHTSFINGDFSLVANMNEQSFVLVDNVNLRNEMITAGLVEVASVEKFNLYLFRKPLLTKDFEILEINTKDTHFEWVDKLKKLVLSDSKKPLWLISKGDKLDGTLGLVKCLRREPGGEKIRCIVDPENLLTEYSPLWERIITSDLAYNIVKENTLGTMKHLLIPSSEKTPSHYCYLNVLTRGDLSSLTWLAAPPPVERDDVVSCNVHYAPLNFRDIMLATGKLPPDALPGSVSQMECILGLEFAGVSDQGNRVMGLLTAGGLASFVQADPYLVWEVPNEWSLKEAATVPVVYATAYYSLVIRGRIQPGESVLIHAGSGGVGQAAISIALTRGCTVYTTVSSEKKRNFLKERFPQLTDVNFANSRDATFEYHILEQTQGKGVDLVLNSLAGDLLQASVRCLKEHGRFLEIGKADLANNTSLGMAIFLKNVTFHGILLDALFEGTVSEKKKLQDVLYEGIASGEVKPLPSTCFTKDEAEEAFRFMASGKHIGKVLLEVAPSDLRGEYEDNNNGLNIPTIPSVFRFWPKPNMVYIITGGLGGLGLELADWLLRRGANKLVLTSRRGVANGYQALCVKRWLSSGANVRISTQDASTEEGAENLLVESSKDGPIGGIFHLATVLEDSILENQSPGSFERVNKVKADGAKHLDTVSRKLCPELHIWVTFSSVACGRGNAGQSNYGWANSVLERVVEQRVADGLPGCAIQWGGIADVGVLVNTLGGNIDVSGTKPQSIKSVLGSLDILFGSKIPIVGSVCLSSKKSSGKDGKGSKSLVASLANILGIRDVSKAPMNVSLGDLGMDSLMAVEIKQTLEREADIILTPEQIRDLTIQKVQEMEGQESKASADESKSPELSSKSSKGNEVFTWLDFPLVPKETIRVIKEGSPSKEGVMPPLFIASPIQGTCDVLSQLASNLSTTVIGLQYTPDLPSFEFSTMIARLVEVFEEYYPEGSFYLGGYSFGASIAFEMASQLEIKGRKPLSLILLDGSHSYVSGVIGTYTNKYDTSISEQEKEFIGQGESEALVTYTIQFCPVKPKELKRTLVKLPSFVDRVNHIADLIVDYILKNQPEKTSYITHDEIRTSASLFYSHIHSSYRKGEANKISLSTLLVRATQNKHFQDLGNDYGLSKVVTGNLTVKESEGSHESFILGENAVSVAQHLKTFMMTTNESNSS